MFVTVLSYLYEKAHPREKEQISQDHPGRQWGAKAMPQLYWPYNILMENLLPQRAFYLTVTAVAGDTQILYHGPGFQVPAPVLSSSFQPMQTLWGCSDGTQDCVPATHMGDFDWFTSSQIWPGCYEHLESKLADGNFIITPIIPILKIMNNKNILFKYYVQIKTVEKWY